MAPDRPESPAEQLWARLNLDANDQVTDAILIARVADFDQGRTVLAIAGTDGMDGITEIGLIHSALLAINPPTRMERDS